MDAVTLVRYDEIGLKGRNRRFFEGRLRENIARALGLPAGAVRRERGRLFVETPDGQPADGAALRALGRVFGIRSFSPALRVANEVPLITEAVLRLAGRRVDGGGTSFAMAARRSEKSFPLTSLELNVALGRAVQDAHPGLAVNLGSPAFMLYLEVRGSGSYVYDRIHAGPGGLPVGSGGRALLLLSGGIDSPVAGWMTLKRGLALDAVHFHSPPYTGARAREKAVAIARELAGWRGQPMRIHLVSVTSFQQAIGRSAPARLWTVMLRRMMVRIAETIARRDRYGALVTGDSLGQVASQTLENMAAVDRAVEIPVLRPLVGFDKMEIVEQARRIGTFGLSIQPFEDCCVLFSPPRPEIRARLEELVAVEGRLPLDELREEALRGAETVELDPRPPRPIPSRTPRSESLSGIPGTD
jgi:thiamine biosynthesis protein ThiI